MSNKTPLTLQLNTILSELPEFVSTFIYSLSNNNTTLTKLEYSRDIKFFLEFLSNFTYEYADKPIKDFTLSDMDLVPILLVNQYLTYIKGEKGKENERKATTVKRRRASLSSMYNFFIRNEKLTRNPVRATESTKLPEKPVIYLTNEEQKKLLDVVRTGNNLEKKAKKQHSIYENRDIAMIILMLDTGLRVSELLSSNIKDYDLEHCNVTVVRKGGDIKEVFYSDECKYYLNIYFETQIAKYGIKNGDFPAFTTTKGNRLTVRAVEMLIKKYAFAALPPSLAGNISPHKLRSSFAMSFYRATNNNILLLQKKLNHKNITTTNIYAKADKKELEESRNVMQNLREQNANL